MNYRTTLYLAFAVAGCIIAYLLFRPDSGERTYQSPSVSHTSSIEKTLIEEDDFGDVVKVECKLRDQDDTWAFQKQDDDGVKQWYVKQPYEAKAVGYQVDRIAAQMTGLRYEIAYDVDGGAVSLQDAGLEPPAASVTITNEKGESRTVEIGKSAGMQQTYVRLAAGDSICVAKSSVSNLFEDSALEYRDKQLLLFESADVTRLEVTHRVEDEEPVEFVLARDDGNWLFESPFTGRAATIVDTTVETLAGLRVSEWVSDDPSRLPVYGLIEPALTIRVTVNEEIEKDEPDEGAKTEEEKEEGETTEHEWVTNVYELHVSSRTPIDEEQKLYARLVPVEDSPGTSDLPFAVALILKSTADKLVPVEKRWRDMDLTAARITQANRIEITTSEDSANLIKQGTNWKFQDTDAVAEQEAVTLLLNSIDGLEARAFVDLDSGDEASFGFDEPQAVIRLTIPGQDQPERFTVGGFSDETSKRLVYVRRNESISVAKVRVNYVEPLIRAPVHYRDRTVFALDGGEFETVTLSHENKFEGGWMELTFGLEEDEWRLQAPVAADVNLDAFEDFLDSLKRFRATRVVTDDGDPSGYGLDEPEASVSVTYLPPKYYRVEPEESVQTEESSSDQTADQVDEDQPTDEGLDKNAETDTGDQTEESDQDEAADSDDENKPAKMVSVEVQPPARTVEITVSEMSGSYYAKLSDSPVIFEISEELYDKFWAEYRDGALLNFEDSQAISFSIREGDTTHEFQKIGDEWSYAAEPDLPLDRGKVLNLLVQLKDIKTERYARYAVKRLGKYGLQKPAWEVSVTLNDDTELRLFISDQTCENDPEERLYAALGATADVFLLSEDTLTRIEVDLTELEAAD